MSHHKNPQISSRRTPQQNRSADLVAAILEAAVQVLSRHGAQGFTTTRVAERAGVSIGSLYQYFPNKAAILFRLQSDEWRQTSELLRGILEDRTRPPLDRLRRLVHAFVRSECEEAAIRIALADAAPFYRDIPEAKAAKASAEQAFEAFMHEALPEVPARTRALAAELIKTSFGAVAKAFSESPRTPGEIQAYSEALADMLCAYLRELAAGTPTASKRPARNRRRSG